LRVVATDISAFEDYVLDSGDRGVMRQKSVTFGSTRLKL